MAISKNNLLITSGLVLTSTVWSGSLGGDITMMPRYIAWCASAIVLVVLLRKDTDFSIVRRNIFPAIGIYIAICALTLVKAVNFGEWFFDVSGTVLTAIYIFLIAVNLKDIREIATPVAVMAIVLGTWGIWQVHTGNTLNIYSIATMGHHGLWSQWMLLLVPFCLAAKNRWIGLTGAAISVYNIYLANTRAAMLALAAAIVITAALFNRRAFVVGIVLLVLISAGIYFHKPSFKRITESSSFKRITNSSSMHSRLAGWKQTLLMTRDNFFVGAGNWKVAIIPYSIGVCLYFCKVLLF